jgi:hypothetical protein
MESSQFDVRYLDDLVLPYDVVTKELDPKPRLVAGSNTWITPGGKLALRPGLSNANYTGTIATGRIDRIASYETIETTPKVYVVASVFDSGTSKWKMMYTRGDVNNPVWTSMGSLRDLDASTRPHEFIVARGYVFIKGFPASSGNKFGSVYFDGTTATTKVWGIPAPPTSADAVGTVVVPTWGASTDSVTVLIGWRYAYCYVNGSQYSNRSPQSYEPSLAQPRFLDSTGQFVNLCPVVNIAGHSDTTNYPQIAIFRTTDGGGTFYHLETITNTGGSIDYIDDSGTATGSNPVADVSLDTFNIAPSLTSNTVPPPYSSGGTKVIGTDPVEASSPLAYYARRIWYFIGNRLFFSGLEEIINGVPEMSFPAPYGLKGNYFDFRHQGRVLKETREALYLITSRELHMIRGEDRTNLRVSKVADMGAALGHPRAIAEWNDVIFWMTNHYQIAAVTGAQKPIIISRPLGDSLKTLATAANAEVDMIVYNQDDLTLLLVAVIDKVSPINTRVFAYDLERQIWFTPWIMDATALTHGRIWESDQSSYLIVPQQTGASSRPGYMVIGKTSDVLGDPNDLTVTLSVAKVPAGNHLNALREPAHHPMLSYMIVEKTGGYSTDVTVQYRLNEFSGSQTTVAATDSPFQVQSTSYKTHWYPIQKVMHRAQLTISKSPVAADSTEIQNIGFVFQPEAGA